MNAAQALQRPNPSPEPDILDAALDYAQRRGWPVFPLRNKKQPLTPHGFKNATCDPNQIRAWWTHWPTALIGIPTAGLVVIDVDLLAANKRIVNMAMELMGARTMQRMAAERDAIGRQSPVVHEFYRRAKEEGLKAAVEWRDARFRDEKSELRG